jgi:anti-sigma-K factor RskA
VDVSAHAKGCGSDVAPYALGALSEEEARRFEEHVRGCELCRSDLEALRPVTEALPSAVEPVEPPPALKRRIMRVVEREARDRERAARREREPRFGALRLRPVAAFAAASVLLLAGAGIGVAVLGEDRASVVQGQCVRGCDGVRMRLDDGAATLKIDRMPSPPPGRVYQVWTQRFGEDPKPTDALFSVDRDGSASVDVPADLDGVDQVLVTDEPAGGSAAPTTAPYLSVRL